jgi:hypothetical protein
LPNSSFAILLIAIRYYKTLLLKIENIILNKQGIKMKKIRYSIYVLLCSLSLVHVDQAHDEKANLIVEDHGTSPIAKKIHETSPVKRDQENAGINGDCGTTPINLSASLSKFPSCPCLQKLGSNAFSADDLVALAAVHSLGSPIRCALLHVPLNQAHGTTPVKPLFLEVLPANSFHGTSPVNGGKK